MKLKNPACDGPTLIAIYLFPSGAAPDGLDIWLRAGKPTGITASGLSNSPESLPTKTLVQARSATLWGPERIK
jgi:hypothetical protein